ncbi:nitrate- and nitrite sensing domain-containing protein [Streptomyces sp. NPDC057702]|uniref:sensor histidine kinase n=1 Tax=unclassified Streptomyces TaxID=2593676 RepID=UPI0036C760E9
MRRSTTAPATGSPQPRTPQGRARGNFTPPTRTGASPDEAPEAPPPHGGPWSPRNWRVPVRLNVILLIPVLVALVFGGLRVASSVDTWREARDAERTARLVRAAAAYGQALINERDVSTVPLLSGRETDEMKQARRETDEAARDFDRYADDMPGEAGLERRLKAFRTVEPRLGSLRQNAFTSQLPGVQTEEGYVTVQHPLMEFANELGLGTGNITSYGRTVYAMSLAKAAESLQRSIGAHLLTKPGPGDADRQAQLTAFSSYAYLERIALLEFESGGMDEDTAHLRKALREAEASGAKKLADARQRAEARGDTYKTPPSMDTMAKAIGTGASPSELRQQGITAESWFTLSTAKFDAYREVEVSLVDKAVDEAAQISSDARRDTYLNSAIVLLALLAAFIVAGLMARSMSRSMRRLRNAALEVAEERLPELVDQLSRAEPGHTDTRVAPIPIAGRDEIGEVARAFDQVHREAVRLAAEQALLRGNVNAIFTNLSRRNQGLIERQLTLISTLENNEADPDQLENLFRMDHLATRMRRNGENLLVLAGEEPGRRWNQPVPLVDVLRAAASEVESYERIELAGVPDSEIHGTAVTDLVHLLAELLENASTFSSPQTKVRVTATRLPDGRVMIEIHDKGIGLTAEDFADINHRLAHPPTVDVAVSQRMGLFVVGRLANRHGIRVQLRPAGEQAGTTSLVMLPEPITHGGGGDDEPSPGDFAVSPIVPEQPAPPASRGPDVPHPAVEPGFADPGAHNATYPDQSSPAYDNGPVTYDSDPAAPYGAGYDGAYGATQPAPYGAERSGDLGTGHAHEGEYAAGYGTGYAAPRDAASAPAGHATDALGDGTYPEGDYADQSTTGQQPYPAHDGQGHQGEWGAADPYQRRPVDGYGAQTEPLSSAAEDGSERVEFDRPGPSPSDVHSITEAGLPRRDKQWGAPDGAASAAVAADHTEPTEPAPEERAEPERRRTDSGWQSANDERWHRAEQLREPKAGGVTPSGLPRRVPKANLVEGTAEESQQGGPQISRAPEDIRGRLSNLRRGVQQGRDAGVDNSTHHQHDQQGFGPGSTYDQER